MASSSAKTKSKPKPKAATKKRPASAASAKGAFLPAVRVDKQLRKDVETVIGDSETMASFIESSVRSQIHERQARQAFLERGLRSRDEAKRTGVYYGSEYVLGQLDGVLAKAKAKAGQG